MIGSALVCVIMMCQDEKREIQKLIFLVMEVEMPCCNRDHVLVFNLMNVFASLLTMKFMFNPMFLYVKQRRYSDIHHHVGIP